MLAHVRLVFRQWRRQPATTAFAVLALGLGIGVNAALLTVFRSVLFRPLAYPQSERLVRLWETYPPHGANNFGTVSIPNLEDWRNGAEAFEEIGGYSARTSTLGGTETPERLRTLAVEPQVLRLLGVPANLGRWFSDDERRGSREAVVVLSERMWRRRFVGGAAIV